MEGELFKELDEAARQATVDKRLYLEKEEEVVAFSDQNGHIVSEEESKKIVVTCQSLHHLFLQIGSQIKGKSTNRNLSQI